MLAKRITSLQHPNVKHWTELRKNRIYRMESKTILIAGKKAIREFPHSIKSLTTLEPSDIDAAEKFLVSEEILKKITGLEQPDGFAAEVPMPSPQELSGKNFILILDQIQDPGNLGTLLRSALALGWEGVIATPGTVDFFNDKALRAGQGAIFRLPYSWQEPEEIQQTRSAVWVADLIGKPLASISWRPPLTLILSSEGQGPSAWTRNIGHRVSIPMQNSVESINVSAAGAILLYAMRQTP